MTLRDKTFFAGSSLAALILASAAVANPQNSETDASEPDTVLQDIRSGQQSVHDDQTTASTDQQEQSGPEADLKEAAEVLAQLKEQEPEFAQKLADAKAVFVVPDYATASLLVGGAGGEGVLLTNENGQWVNPGFYDIGNIDIGLQAGGAAGSMVFALMNDEALKPFHSSGTEFELTAEAGLTIVNWSAEATAAGSDEGDVLVWTDTEGLLAEASIGVGGLSWDEEEANEYYGQGVEAEQVLAGNVQNPHEATLQSEFAEFSTSGDSSSETEGDSGSYDAADPQHEYPQDEQ
ncbi:MAG TPA: lipid-binding SYLF domain-containing protein [Pseudomonadales bacterium]